MNRVLDRATPMLKAIGTEEATVVFKSGDNDDKEEYDDDDQNEEMNVALRLQFSQREFLRMTSKMCEEMFWRIWL